MADTEDTETLAASIGGCFSNVMDLPEWMRVQALGRSMRPLTLIAARAVLKSSWLLARDERIRADEREKLAADFAHRAAVYEAHPEYESDRYLDGYATGMRVAEKIASTTSRLAGEVEAR